MNLKNLCNRIGSSMLAPCIVASVAFLGAHSVSAQSITVTTTFPFCVNKEAYPIGTYQFTLLSDWILSVHNVNRKGEQMFAIRPGDGGIQGSASRAVRSVGGATFRTFRDFWELTTVSEPVADTAFELIEEGIQREKPETHRPVKPINCFTQQSTARTQNTAGR